MNVYGHHTLISIFKFYYADDLIYTWVSWCAVYSSSSSSSGCCCSSFLLCFSILASFHLYKPTYFNRRIVPVTYVCAYKCIYSVCSSADFVISLLMKRVAIEFFVCL